MQIQHFTSGEVGSQLVGGRVISGVRRRHGDHMANLPTINASEILKAIAYIGGLVGAIYGFKRYVESLVTKKLESHETIDKVSRLIRPSVIFDNKGIILADLGAMEYVKSIDLSYDDKEPELPVTVEIKCKQFLALPPLLTSLDNYSYQEKATRDKELSWVFELEPMSYVSDAANFRFRLEILSV